MSEIKTGGPAFPTENARQTGNTTWHYEGMTLRDYFAAKAMPAIYRDMWDDVRAGRYDSVFPDWRYGVAMDAYKMADEMLKARGQQT